MKYDVVIASELSSLIEKGWEPQGGISTMSVWAGYEVRKTYSQAMIKKDG